MKKTIVYITAILLLSVAVVTLFAVTDKTPGDGHRDKGAASVSFTKDNTVLPDFVYNNSIIGESSVYTIHLSDTEYDDEDDADYVALGTVIETFYTFVDGKAWTQANIRVDENIHGRLSSGQIISVYMSGGYASAEDYLSSGGRLGSTGDDPSYVEFIVNDRPHPKPGDNEVFYLEKLPSDLSLPDGAYMCLNIFSDDTLYNELSA